MLNDVELSDCIVRLNDNIVELEDDVMGLIVLGNVLKLARSDVVELEAVSC